MGGPSAETGRPHIPAELVRELKAVHEEMRAEGLSHDSFDLRVATHEALRLYIRIKQQEMLRRRIIRLAEAGKLTSDVARRLYPDSS